MDSKEEPIEQIKKKRYYEKYLKEGKPIYLIGMKFDSNERNIVDYEIDKI